MSTLTPLRSGSARPSTSGTPLASYVSSPLRQQIHATDDDEARVEAALEADASASQFELKPGVLGASGAAETIGSGSGSRPASRRQSRASFAPDVPAPVTSTSSPRRSMGRASLVKPPSPAKPTPRSSLAAAAPLSGRPSQFGSDENVRLRRLEEGLSRFLGLVDEKATLENFASALPEVPSETLDALRTQLVADLKDQVLTDHAELLNEYDVPAKLSELQTLSIAADRLADRSFPPEHDALKSVWRAGIPLETALHAPSIPIQKDSIAKLSSELREIEERNATLHEQLRLNVAEADQRQGEVAAWLEALSTAVKELQPAPGEEKKLRTVLEALSVELGPRA